jgi:Uma2 family endonuclease
MTTLIIPTDAPAISGPQQGQWTYADWVALPDDGNRYEVINGVLFMTTAPHSFHQWVIRRLERFVGIPAEDQQLAFAFSAPIGVLMPGCDPVQPDYVVVRFERQALFRDGRIYGVPDLIFEIASPSTRAYDLRVKLPAYAAASVPEYIIVEPSTRTLQQYVLDVPGRYAAPRIASGDHTVSLQSLPAISFRLSDLFDGAPDTAI